MSTGPSLYRRHRPRTFAEVVGQEHVVRTLQNAVSQGKVHHAYLFVGSRGTGKTSTAKILAACLNCERGPTVEPCGQCESCVAIANATSLDVIEMDAASNNSVDDIRDLREKVALAPVSGRHKVYILDEAHMLSPQAWNAFLKTLEEPPPRTIFVLATTEAQKVLPTVVDRCHRFDFGRPSIEQVATVLDRVCEAEQIAVEPGALPLIARHATGSFRDALGTLEQLRTYTGERPITVPDVLAVLGVSDAEQLFEAVEAIAARDPAQALRSAAKLAGSGRDPVQVLRDLERHGRELLTVQVLGEVPAEARLTPDGDERLLQQAQKLGREDVIGLLDLIAGALDVSANGASARIQLELALVKAATASGAPAGSVSPAPPAPVTNQSDGTASGDLEAALRSWPAVVELVRGQNAMLAALLGDARPVEISHGVLTLAFPDGAAFLKRKAEQDDYRRVAGEALAQVTGQRLTLRYELRERGEEDKHPRAAEPSGEELVRRFIEEFDAEEIFEDDEHEVRG